MPNFDPRGTGPALIPAREPERKLIGQANGPAMPALGSGGGTAHEPYIEDEVRLWIDRQKSWSDGFEQEISGAAKRYWQLYRNIDAYPTTGPDSSWRDKTVVPGPFRVLMTRVPRIFLGLFSGKEWFVVEGRGAKDERYESTVKNLLECKISQMDMDSRQEAWLHRVLEALTYEQIVGHVWWKLTWKRDWAWRKVPMPQIDPATGQPEVDEAGRVKFSSKLTELPEMYYNGLDLQWMGLDRLAINLEGPRRWAIEPIFTTLEAMKQQDADWRKLTGEGLYPPEQLELLKWQASAIGPEQQAGYMEPRDNLGWPMGDMKARWGLVGEQLVELWLCWDNEKRTLTKIANRSIVLDHGDAPTPDGLDPYWGTKAVAVPGRTYGDSILNWTGDLHQYETRLRRGRADEILLNLFQQFMFRTGSITSPKLLFKPGGAIGVETVDPTRPIAESFGIIPRRPVFEEAWREQQWTAQETESTAAADVLHQGGEATQRSRDVSATEIEQRVTQGNERYQMENLDKELTWKRPFLTRAFQLLQMHLTQPEVIRVMEEEVSVDLTQIQTPVDIKVGGGIYEYSKAERGRDVLEAVSLAQTDVFAPYMKPGAILKKLLQVRDWQNPEQYIRTDEEVQQLAQQQQAQQMQMEAMKQGSVPGGPANGNPQGALAANLATQTNGGNSPNLSPLPGVSGSTGPANSLGVSPEEAPGGPGTEVF